MKLIRNSGSDRVIDIVRAEAENANKADCVTPHFSLFAYSALSEILSKLAGFRLLLPSTGEDLHFCGTDADRAERNKLQTRWLANHCARWVLQKAEVRTAQGTIPQSSLILRSAEGTPTKAVIGSFGFSTGGLGLVPTSALNLVQASESAEDTAILANWFEQQWKALDGSPAHREEFAQTLRQLGEYPSPESLYALILHRLFRDTADTINEDLVIDSATGFRNTKVWRKLYRFQRDAVVGALDKLTRFGGCIIADSVGLGKTFEALAVIKYYELRNSRVLVIAPKRLRDNWNLFRANEKRNSLSEDRFSYDLLNHTDLSRDRGQSGDIDLSQINWGNYDLVVIDESHNFRNKSTHKDRESRYDRLMQRVIREGIKTRVLMLSATPVNNRLADLKNQIAFVTEGRDNALEAHGIASIEKTTRTAQAQFNRWLKTPAAERNPASLVDMLGFDYFTLLDHLTIARSRKHIERYYGTQETGKFPERLPPINLKANVDAAGTFRAIEEINREIRKLNLSSYAPLRYVLPHKQAEYDAVYNTSVRDGQGTFRQSDREESLIHLMRVNALKRMESSVVSFRLTVERQLADVEAILARIESNSGNIETPEILDIDIEDPAYEPLLAGKKVKVLLGDVDLVRWKQDLKEDKERLSRLLEDTAHVSPTRDAKLAELRSMIAEKVRNPINPGNKKVIIFTAFSDTAEYLYAQVAEWARETLGLYAALVTGSAGIQTNLPRLPRRMGEVLSAFAPRAKERPSEFAGEGELNLLIATDCISEGQNLQDCDWLINYDIHWNPVRIIQRFGRIDRLGSPNTAIQLVNFWPNMELEEYIKLEQRVSGRMVLLDVSATGEENLIDQQADGPMNDLEYRRKQLLKLQDSVIDMEDLSTGLSITDLTLTDFRIDLAQFLKERPDALSALPPGAHTIVTSGEDDIPPGIIFCLRDASSSTLNGSRKGIPDHPLAPYYMVHVGEDGAVLLSYLQTKHVLDRLKRLSAGRSLPDAAACTRFDRMTREGEDMRQACKLLASAVASVTGKQEERAVASLFTPGGTQALSGEFAGAHDFEVEAFLVILPQEAA